MSKEQDDKLLRTLKENDPNAASRKRDHIELAFQSQIGSGELDRRFHYEPLLAAHPERGSLPHFQFLGKSMRAPIWISSMTGGTELAQTINQNLARACRDFGMGMGLGSCRSILFGEESLRDFDVRGIIGEELPLFANLGIAQIEDLLLKGELYRLKELVDKLQADGLIIHVNPLQEWLQPEGDHFRKPPIDTIKYVLEEIDFPLIVKEVGQGMGYESLKALFQLPLAAVDFAAGGGTNFAKLELLRSKNLEQSIYSQLALIGHSAEEMVDSVNRLIKEPGVQPACKQVIISGGIKNFLDGYYLIHKLNLSCVYGQASGFLKHAREDYQALYEYVDAQLRGLELANALLKIKE